MKPQALLAGFALLLTACGGPENRSVSEELPLEEVNALLKKNPDYQEAVTLAERFRATASTVEKARANDLTYEALQTFLDSLSDSGVRDRLREQADAEWEKRYGETAQRIPGLIAHWRHFLDSLRPESYVSVRLLSIDPRESTYGTARVVLEIAPTKGPIDRIEGRFGLFLRDRAHGFDDFSADLTRCGTAMPTNDTGPANAVTQAESMLARRTSTTRKRATFTPTLFA